METITLTPTALKDIIADAVSQGIRAYEASKGGEVSYRQAVIVPGCGGAVIDRAGVAVASHLSDHAVLLAVEERQRLAHGAGDVFHKASSHIVMLQC